MSDLFWITVTPSSNPNFLTKGTILSQAIFGPNKRYMAQEIRSYDRDNMPDRRYVVRDAETISDHQVKLKVQPKIVFQTESYDQLLTFVKSHS